MHIFVFRNVSHYKVKISYVQNAQLFIRPIMENLRQINLLCICIYKTHLKLKINKNV